MFKRKKIKTLLLTHLLLIGLISSAQTQNPYFTVPPYSSDVQTSTGPHTPVLIPNYSNFSGGNGLFYYSGGGGGGSAYKSNYAHNMIADASGKALTYIMDGNFADSAGNLFDNLKWTKYDTVVWDGLDHKYEPRCWGIFEDISGFSEVCVVPNPQNCKQFFFFLSGAVVNKPGGTGNICTSTYNDFGAPYGVGGIYRFFNNYFYPFYGMIDFSKNNSNGTPGKLKLWATRNSACNTTAMHTDSFNVAPIFPLLYPSSFSLKNFASHYAATDVIGSGGSAYNLLFYSDGYKCFALKFDGTTPLTLLSTDSLLTANQTTQFRSEMEVVKLSGGNYRVAWPYMNAVTGSACIHIQDYTSAGAKVAGTSADVILTPTGSNPTPYIHGMEFTTDGSKLYFTHETTADYSGYIYYVSVSLPAVLNTVGTPPSVSDLQYSQIELNYQSATPYLYLADSTNIVSLNPSGNTWNSTAATFPTSPAYYYKADLTAGGQGFITNLNPVFPTYLLPDQIDGGYYPGSSGFNSACCTFYNSYTVNKFIANGASHVQVWQPGSNPFGNTSGTVYVENELRIPTNYSVTIRNMNFKFTPQATMVVEGYYSGSYSGQLIMRKCTLDVDNRCVTKMWPGIRVWGDNSVGRSNSAQGYINIDSSSVITNAWVGIELGYQQGNEWKYNTGVVPKPPGTDSTKAGGGIIICQNSSFINNQKDIYFGDYAFNTSGTSSIFKNTFTTNAYLVGGSSIPPLYHIQLSNYKPNANIQGCTFSCSSSLTASGYAFGCQGINSSSSTFSVDKYTTGSIRSVLSNFLYGVFATSSNSNTMAVKNSNLMNNVVGVYMGTITNGTVQSDSFKIYNTTASSGNVTGLYLDNSTGYKVQDNYITRYASGNKNPYGIVVYNSGAYVNCIFRNRFSLLYKGIQVQYKNWVPAPPSTIRNAAGLVLLCNTFDSTKITNADIYIPATGSSANVGSTYLGTDTAGVAFNQGTGNSGYPKVGGNSFSHTSGGKDLWFETGKAFNSAYIYYCPSGSCTTSLLYPAVYNNLFANNPYAFDVGCSTTDPYSNSLRISDPFLAMLGSAAELKTKCDSLKAVINALSPNDPNKTDLSITYGAVFSSRHRVIDEAIHYLIDNPSDSSQAQINVLMKEKALELPARARLETAIYLGDPTWATTELNNVKNEEGQNTYTQVYTVLVNNVGKSYEEIMQNPSNVSLMQAIDKDSSDKRAYLVANNLLASIGLSNYQLYYQENAPSTDSTIVRKGKKDENMLLSASSFNSKPNPFKESTTISATIVEKTTAAYIVITNMFGEEITRYQLQQGQNEVNFNSSDINQQVFFCTLIIDGVKIKTNKMVLIK